MNKRRRYLAKRRRRATKCFRDLASTVPHNLRGIIDDGSLDVTERQWAQLAAIAKGRRVSYIGDGRRLRTVSFGELLVDNKAER